LPDGSGLEVMESMRARWPDAKGVALGGFGMDSDIERSREVGFQEHLIKPVEVGTLQAVLAGMCEQPA
jgi:CheY-like chemotaxis protein